MNASVTTVRRGLFGMFAGGLLAFGTAGIVAPVANSQPAPAPSFDCSASTVAGTVSTAAASEGAYLIANPQTNEALSQISTEPQPQAQQAYAAFFAQNPQVSDQLTAIHEPVSALKGNCGITISPTPVAQAVWDAAASEDIPLPVAPSDPMNPAPGETPAAPEMPMA